MSGAGRHAGLRCVLLSDAADAGPGATIEVPAEKLQHLRKVLRMDWGQTFRALDGEGREFEATLEKSGERAFARLGALVRQEPAPLELELVIGLPKNATMDEVVEKAVECGATRISPVVTSRSVVIPASSGSEADGGKHAQRWRRIMDGAQEQAETLWRCALERPASWRDFMTDATKGPSRGVSLAFVTELRDAGQPDAQVLAETLQSIRTAHGQELRIMIGPEGGFTSVERQELESAGFVLLSMGATVLRVETAVVSALTLARVIRMVSAS